MRKGWLDGKAALAAAVVPLQVFLLLPLAIFLPNTVEFTVGLAEIAVPLLALTLIGFVALYLFCLLGFWCRAAAVCLGLLLFVQSTFLFGLARHQPFTGQVIDWSGLGGVARWEWAALVLTLALAAVAMRLAGREKTIRAAALLVLVLQTAGLAAVLIERGDQVRWARAEPEESDLSRYYEGFSRLSERRNVILIVFDHMQGSLVREVLEADMPRYVASLEGFTLFFQAAGKYSGTYPSVPYLMTGEAPDVGSRVAKNIPFTHEYIARTLKRRSIVRDLKEAGFSRYGLQVTTIYCTDDYDSCVGGSIFDGLPPQMDRTEEVAAAILKLMDVTLFRVFPVTLRKRVYNDEQWLLRGMAEKKRSISGTVDYFIDHLEVDAGSAGSFNFFHHQGGHPTIQFDRDCNYVGSRKWNKENTKEQVACALAQVERLADRLKSLGVYDQTMIVLAGDHGSQWRTPLMRSLTGRVVAPRIISSANPLVMVKPPGTREPLRFSGAPADLGDIPDTIATAFGLQRRASGTPLFELAEDQIRDRQYLWFPPDRRIFQDQIIPRVEPFLIRGDLFNQYDWIPPILDLEPPAPSRLNPTDDRFESFTQGFSAPDGKGVRWVEGRLGRVYLSAGARRPRSLALEAAAPSGLESQSLLALVNDRVVLRLDRLPASSWKLLAPLPPDLPLQPVNVVELRMADSVPTADGKQEVSLLLRSIGFE